MKLKATSVKIPLPVFEKMNRAREKSMENQTDYIIEAIRRRLGFLPSVVRKK